MGTAWAALGVIRGESPGAPAGAGRGQQVLNLVDTAAGSNQGTMVPWNFEIVEPLSVYLLNADFTAVKVLGNSIHVPGNQPENS